MRVILLLPFLPIFAVIAVARAIHVQFRLRQYTYGNQLLQELQEARDEGRDDSEILGKLDQHTRRMDRFGLL